MKKQDKQTAKKVQQYQVQRANILDELQTIHGLTKKQCLEFMKNIDRQTEVILIFNHK